MEIKDLEKSATEVSGLLKLLSNPNRLMILCQLVNAEQNVNELCELVSMRPAAMSQQLSILRREGLVQGRREAQSIYYSITDKKVRKLMAFLYKTYCNDAYCAGEHNA